MRKIDDFFFAGLIAGAMGGAGIFLLNITLLLLGVPHGTYWQAMGGLFYNKQLMKTVLAQIHGAIDALGVSAANGVLTCFVLKYTGRDYLYFKSAALSAFSAYFLFLAVYPQTGLSKNSPVTPWVALFGHTIFTGLFVGYILTKIYSFNRKPKSKNILDDEPDREYENSAPRQPIRYKVVHPPLTGLQSKNTEEEKMFKKPKKIRSNK